MSTLKTLTKSLAAMLPAAAFAATSPSTTVDPYITTHLPGITITSILTVDDGMTIPDTDGGTTRLVGIPDGMGAYDGSEVGENGYFYLLVNHEIPQSQGIIRDHGGMGAFVSKWKIDKTTLEAVEGEDLIKEVYLYNGTSFVLDPTYTFDRLCSADLPGVTATYNATSGLGSQEIIYFDGEETSGGSAFAHFVTGANAGKSYQLDHMGYAAWENVLLSPFAQDKTIAILTDDDSNGEVYLYVGDKTDTGSEVEKAGLLDGVLYAIAVEGKPFEIAENDGALADYVMDGDTFVLKTLGIPGDRPSDGSETTARGTETANPVVAGENYESLKFGGPEDGAWDTRPGFENWFYFVTKGTSSGGNNAQTRLWALEFSDIAQPELGGTIHIIADSALARLGSFDNMDFEVIDGEPKLYIQEDLGGDSRLSKIWEYNLATDIIEELAEHDADVFFTGGANFLTTNEEASGIISLKDILGEGWFAMSIQVHTSSGLSESSEMVEHGQIVLMNIDGRGTDALRKKVVCRFQDWDFLVDGSEPPAGWNDVDFVIPGGWNTTTDGTPFGGPQPAPLGYGESGGKLATDLVQPNTPRPPAYFFRQEFDHPDPENLFVGDLYAQFDDGIVVYINGVEVGRSILPLDVEFDGTQYAGSLAGGSENDWRYLPLNIQGVTFRESGNVLAVALLQEGPNSSDTRFDAELVLWCTTPDAGTAPVQTTGLAVANPTFETLDITWDVQAGVDFYRIERRVAGDVAWETIEEELPGIFEGIQDILLEQGTNYEYRITPFNIYGTAMVSDVASGTTAALTTPILFEEDFESDSFGGFTTVDVAGEDRNWSIVSWNFGSTFAAQGNGFGGASPTEDWLISPAFNLAFTREEMLTYGAQINFGGPIPELLFSVDYDPAVHTDPNSATWEVLQTLPTDLGEAAFVTQGPFDLSAYEGIGYFALVYKSDGGSGGQSFRFTVDNFEVRGEIGYDFEGNASGHAFLDEPLWTIVNKSSTGPVGGRIDWHYDEQQGQTGAFNNNFGAVAGGETNGTAADDWLISPVMIIDNPDTAVVFDYYEQFGDTLEKPLAVLVTTNYTGDPDTTTWIDITPIGLNGSTSGAWIEVVSQVMGVTGTEVQLAFHYRSGGDGGGSTKRIGIDNVGLDVLSALETGMSFAQNGLEFDFNGTVTGGTPPYEYLWDFGDGSTSTEEDPTYRYAEPGTYTVQFLVTDADQVGVGASQDVTIESFLIGRKPAKLRIASYNVQNRGSSNTLSETPLITDLPGGNDEQYQAVAEAIQRIRPDVLLINEFDYEPTNVAVESLINEYMAVSQNGERPIEYPYYYNAPSNTGIHSGYDLRNDGTIDDTPGDQDYGDDAFGFGTFEGHYSFVILSRYPIDEDNVRTFQKFRWMDMPDANLPLDPNDTDGDGDTSSYYTQEELEFFRLSSKNHVDVPVIVEGESIHILASHPTPPTFDDGEDTLDANGDPTGVAADWNGHRNHDEVRFFSDYVDPSKSAYIYDDMEYMAAQVANIFDQDGDGDNRDEDLNNNGILDPGEDTDGDLMLDIAYDIPEVPASPAGGLPADSYFFIMGDYNADPTDGDATGNPAQVFFVDSTFIDTSFIPMSTQLTNPDHTSTFGLRVDYALPSVFGWLVEGSAVFWPRDEQAGAELVTGSDHFMVYVDVNFDAPDLDYVTFASDNGLVQGQFGDDDGDGDSNYKEFVLQTNANSANVGDGAPRIFMEDGKVYIEMKRVKNAGIEWVVQKSQTIEDTDWTDAVEGVDYQLVTVAINPDGSEVVDFEILESGLDCEFFRVISRETF